MISLFLEYTSRWEQELQEVDENNRTSAMGNLLPVGSVNPDMGIEAAACGSVNSSSLSTSSSRCSPLACTKNDRCLWKQRLSVLQDLAFDLALAAEADDDDDDDDEVLL